MKILFCGDKHLKITRFDLAKQCLAWLNSVIDEHKPDMYICLGDDMDSHAIWSINTNYDMRCVMLEDVLVHALTDLGR